MQGILRFAEATSDVPIYQDEGFFQNLERFLLETVASPHISPRAAKIAPDFALVRVLASGSIAQPSPKAISIGIQ